MEITIGKKVFFKSNNTEYEVVNQIGKGGQGAVYKVKNLSDGKFYALKELVGDDDRKRKNITTLIKEDLNGRTGPTGISNKIKYTFPITEEKDAKISAHESQELYVMDLAYGNTLGKLFNDGAIQKMDLVNKVKLARQIAKSIQIINDLGYCYTDINLGNFMVDIKSGWLYIVDCENVASNTEIQTSNMTENRAFVIGTGVFMAPEVAFGLANAGKNADRYALAVLFLRILTNNLIMCPYYGKIMYSNELCEDMNRVKELVDDDDIDEAWSVFVFDENDHRNGIEDIYKDADASRPNQQRKRRELDEAIRLWSALDDRLKSLFRRAFKNPLENYNFRPSPLDWVNALDEALKKLLPPAIVNKPVLEHKESLQPSAKEKVVLEQLYVPFVPVDQGTSSALEQKYEKFVPKGQDEAKNS